jgi:hypothetical protein
LMGIWDHTSHIKKLMKMKENHSYGY